jgi:hypothetical protein
MPQTSCCAIAHGLISLNIRQPLQGKADFPQCTQPLQFSKRLAPERLRIRDTGFCDFPGIRDDPDKTPVFCRRN